MDNFKVLFCPFVGRKFRAHLVGENSTRRIGQLTSGSEKPAGTTPRDSKVSYFRFTHLQSRHLVRLIRNLALTLVAVVVPLYLVGCGGGPSVSAQLTPPSSTSSGTGTTATGTSGGSGSTDTTATGTTGTSGTGTTGTTGTSSTGSTGSTGTGSTGTTGTGTTGTGSTGATGSGGTGTTTSGDTQGTVIRDIQGMEQNWKSWGQGGPYYVDCSPSPCNGYAWSMKFGITLPSLSNNATKFVINGTKPYGDALFSADLIGTASPTLKDSNHTLLPTVHNFTYDTDFYVTDLSITQTLEFDISMYMNGAKMIFGTQCSHRGDKSWDIYDNVNGKWVSAGIPCKMVNGWNHLTIHVQRKSDNTLVYQSIDLDGTNYTLNRSYPPGTAPSTWWGITVNYQMDGDSTPDANTTYLDNFSLTYW